MSEAQPLRDAIWRLNLRKVAVSDKDLTVSREYKEFKPVNDHRPTRGKNGIPLRWLARGLSIVTGGVFLLIIGLALTNEDRPGGAAVPVLILLGLTLIASVAAWRWERAGGLVVILLAFGLTIAAYSSSRAVGLGSQALLPALLYGGPFLVVGTLFWLSGRDPARPSRPVNSDPSPRSRV
jgi:hypothetical protein